MQYYVNKIDRNIMRKRKKRERERGGGRERGGESGICLIRE